MLAFARHHIIYGRERGLPLISKYIWWLISSVIFWRNRLDILVSFPIKSFLKSHLLVQVGLEVFHDSAMRKIVLMIRRSHTNMVLQIQSYDCMCNWMVKVFVILQRIPGRKTKVWCVLDGKELLFYRENKVLTCHLSFF